MKTTTKEHWKGVKGFIGLYQISNHGRVISLYFNQTKLLKPTPTGQGKYLRVDLYKPNQPKQRWYIHDLVSLHFIGLKPKNKVVNHKDGNKHNNRVRNLEYITQAENNKHAIANGLCSEVKCRKLSDKQIIAIRRSNATGVILAHKYNVSTATISMVKSRKVWKNL